jgi:hypothetical protein
VTTPSSSTPIPEPALLDFDADEIDDGAADAGSPSTDVATNAAIAELARSSFAAPVLTLAYIQRDDAGAGAGGTRFEGIGLFVRRAILRRDTAADLLLRLCHAGLLSSIPLLAVNLYFLLSVTQVGMSASNWLALLNCFVLVPRLVGMAAWSWWRQRAAASTQESATSLKAMMPPSISELAPSGRDAKELELASTASMPPSVAAQHEAVDVVLAPSSSSSDHDAAF